MQITFNNKMILLTIAVTLMGIASAYAQPPERRGWEEKKARREAMRKELFDKLNLSPEQQKVLDANRTEHRQKMQELFQNIRSKRMELREELQKPILDLEKIKARQGELKTLFSSMLDLRLEGILKASEILTPEQRKIMSEFLKEKRKDCPPFGDRERMDVPPPPFDDMEGMDFTQPPPFTVMGTCITVPPFGHMRGMDVPHLPFSDLESMFNMD